MERKTLGLAPDSLGFHKNSHRITVGIAGKCSDADGLRDAEGLAPTVFFGAAAKRSPQQPEQLPNIATVLKAPGNYLLFYKTYFGYLLAVFRNYDKVNAIRQ